MDKADFEKLAECMHEFLIYSPTLSEDRWRRRCRLENIEECSFLSALRTYSAWVEQQLD